MIAAQRQPWGVSDMAIPCMDRQERIMMMMVMVIMELFAMTEDKASISQLTSIF